MRVNGCRAIGSQGTFQFDYARGNGLANETVFHGLTPFFYATLFNSLQLDAASLSAIAAMDMRPDCLARDGCDARAF